MIKDDRVELRSELALSSGCVWEALAALSAALMGMYSLSAAACQTDLKALAGMDDDVMVANVRRLYEASWTGFREAMLPMAAQSSLGVYEPVALTFRLLVAHAFGGVSLHAMAIVSLTLHAIVVAQTCVFTQLLLRRFDGHLEKPGTYSGATSDLCSGRRQLDAPRVTRTRQPALCAFVASSFFGSHPMRVEVVCWMSCQPYLLASSLCLLCMICRLRGDFHRTEILIFATAAFSKAAVIALPAVLASLEAFCVLCMRKHGLVSSTESVRRKLLSSFLRWNAPFVVISLCAAITSAIAAGPVPLDTRSLLWHESLYRSAFAVCFYAWRAIAPPWPWTTPRFSMPSTISAMDPSFGLSALVVTLSGFSLLTLSLLPAHPSCQVARLWLSVYVAYLLFLLPCSGLASGGHVWALAADRFDYRPPLLVHLLGVMTIGVVLVAVNAQSKTVTSHWIGGSVQLFEAILDTAPNEFSTLKDLGSLRAKQGHTKAAVETLQLASDLRPSHPGVLLNLATVLHQEQRLQEAEMWYTVAHEAARFAVTRCPDCIAQATELAKVDANAAALLLQSRRASEAVVVLEAAWPWRNALPTTRAPAFYHLGLAYASLGQREKAARSYRAAISSSPRVGNGAALEALARLEHRLDVSGIR